MILTGAVIFFFLYFQVKTVEVSGSGHYTDEEIKELVLKGPLASNTILAPALYSKSNMEEIPFIESVEVTQTGKNSILISVSEIKSVGCIRYLDCYIYFDRHGEIVATSVDRDYRVPYFEGLSVASMALGEKLPFGDDSLLNSSVSLSRIFEKSGNIPDHIYLDENGNIVLMYGEIAVRLGKSLYLEDKMMRMDAILEKIKGQKGILHLENVTDINKTITFEKELTEEEKKAAEEGEEEGEPSEDENDDAQTDSGYDSSQYDSSGYDSSWE